MPLAAIAAATDVGLRDTWSTKRAENSRLKSSRGYAASTAGMIAAGILDEIAQAPFES